jgi:hypothetical protein
MDRLPRPIVSGAIFALAWLVMSGGAEACAGRIASAPAMAADYAPFRPVDYRGEHRVTVENQGDGECVFWLGIRQAGAPPPGAELAFEIRGRDGGWSSTNAIAAPVWIESGLIAPGQSKDLVVSVILPAGQILPPGEFIHSFDALLRAAPAGSSPEMAPQLESRPLRLTVSIDAYLSINIAGAGARKTIDFGELVGGAQREVRIEARSNQKFALEATSRNGGAMALAAPFETWRVGYSVALGGRPVALPADVGPFEGTGLAGQQLDLAFIVGDVRNKRAGLYTDEVTIEIKPAL